MNENDIRLLTCNNLFITYYMLKKNHATKLNYKKALIKLQNNSSRQIWNIACNPIGPTKLLQFIWLDNSNPWSDMISFHSVKWYHITSRVSFFLFTALSHWYPHIICNNHSYHTRLKHQHKTSEGGVGEEQNNRWKTRTKIVFDVRLKMNLRRWYYYYTRKEFNETSWHVAFWFS